MRKIWVVVANSSLCKIYRAENQSGALAEYKVMEHEESRLKGSDLESGPMGRMPPSGVARGCDSMAEPTPYKVKEQDRFAEQVSDFINKGYNGEEFTRLYLIAKSPFLGHLRGMLSENIIKLIVTEIQKDLTQLRPEEIREYLPPVL